jgi:hypothetical protein
MSLILTFTRKWVRWYRVLRYHKAFSFADSVPMVCGCRLAKLEGILYESSTFFE